MPSTSTDRISGISTSVAVKAPVFAATVGNITLSGAQPVDSFTPPEGARILVRAQNSAVENGIYDYSSTTAWTRSEDFMGARDVVGGTLIAVNNTAASNKIYRVDGDGEKIPGTNAITLSPLEVTAVAENTTALNIAALKNFPITSSLVHLLGRNTANDGGSGNYAWLAGDYSAQVAGDPGENDFVVKNGVPATTGVFARLSRSIPRRFNIGTLPADLDSWIRKGSVHLQGHRIAAADGSTSDSENITALITEMSAAGGGQIFAESTNSFYKMTTLIPIRNGVSIVGLGKSSRFVNAQTTGVLDIFMLGAMHPSNLEFWTFHACASISPGNRSVTLITPLAGNVYAVGDIIMVRSNDDTNPTDRTKPSFVNLCKITDVTVDGGGNTTALTFEYPIEYSVADPLIAQIAGQLVGGVSNYVCDTGGLHNLRLYSELGRGFFYNALYNGHISNIYHEKSRYMTNGNGLARSLVENIRGLYTSAFVEFAIGCHDSVIRDVRGALHPQQTSSVSNLIKIGEFVHNNRLTDFEADAYGWVAAIPTSANAIGFSSAGIDTEISHGRILGVNCFSGIEFTGQAIEKNIGNAVIDVELRGTFDNYFKYSSSNNVPVDCDILDCRFYGTVVDHAKSGTLASGKILRNYFEQGQINLSSPVMEFRDNTVYTYSNSATALLRRLTNNTRRLWASAHAVAVWLNNIVVTTTTSGTVVPGGSFVVPAGMDYLAGDQFVFYAAGDAAGAATKDIVLADNTGTLLSVSMLTTEVGAFVIEGRIQVHAIAATSYTMDAEYSVLLGSHAVPVRVRRTGLDLPLNGRTLSLQAWVGAGGTITFDRIEIRPLLVGE